MEDWGLIGDTHGLEGSGCSDQNFYQPWTIANNGMTIIMTKPCELKHQQHEYTKKTDKHTFLILFGDINNNINNNTNNI